MKIGGKHFVLINKLQGLLGMTSTAPFVLITVTQVQGASGRFTDPIPVINYLKDHKVKLGFEIPKIINLLTSLAGMKNEYENQVSFYHVHRLPYSGEL